MLTGMLAFCKLDLSAIKPVDPKGTEQMAKEAKEPEVSAEDFKKAYGYYLKDETKAQAFSRIASRRMGQALTEIRKLETLSEKNNYEYTDEQASKILKALQDACQGVADRFAGKVRAKESFQV